MIIRMTYQFVKAMLCWLRFLNGRKCTSERLDDTNRRFPVLFVMESGKSYRLKRSSGKARGTTLCERHMKSTFGGMHPRTRVGFVPFANFKCRPRLFDAFTIARGIFLRSSCRQKCTGERPRQRHEACTFLATWDLFHATDYETVTLPRFVKSSQTALF